MVAHWSLLLLILNDFNYRIKALKFNYIEPKALTSFCKVLPKVEPNLCLDGKTLSLAPFPDRHSWAREPMLEGQPRQDLFPTKLNGPPNAEIEIFQIFQIENKLSRCMAFCRGVRLRQKQSQIRIYLFVLIYRIFIRVCWVVAYGTTC